TDRWLDGWSREPTLTRLHALLLIQIFRHFNWDHYRDTGELKAWPGQERLALMCGATRNGVQKALKEIEKTGAFRIVGSSTGGRGITNTYIGQKPLKRLFDKERKQGESANYGRSSSAKVPTAARKSANSHEETANSGRKTANPGVGATSRKELKGKPVYPTIQM